MAQRSFTIGIVDDEEAEARETIVFEVRTEGDHRSPEHTVTIRDDDTTVIRNASVVNGPGADGVWSDREPVELEVRYNYPVEVEQPSDCWAYNDDGTCRESGPFLVVSFRSDARPGYGRVLSTPLAPYEGGSGTNRLRVRLHGGRGRGRREGRVGGGQRHPAAGRDDPSARGRGGRVGVHEHAGEAGRCGEAGRARVDGGRGGTGKGQVRRSGAVYASGPAAEPGHGGG